MRLTLHGTRTPIEVIADSISINPNYGDSFVVHQTPHGMGDSNIDRFRVSHLATGFRVGWGMTIDQAIHHAQTRLKSVGQEKFREAVERANKEITRRK
jgi:hypothetical protein